MALDDIRRKTKSFITANFKNYDLKDDDDIFALGFVNSLFAMQLVMFVESAFDLRIEDDELDIAHFRSLNAIAEFVERKKSSI